MIESILPRSNSDAFKTVITEFVPQGTPVLDATAGHRQFWETILGQGTLNLASAEAYPVTFMDVRDMPDINLQADLRQLPFANGVFGCIVFDPPYTFNRGNKGRRSMRTGSIYHDDPQASGLLKNYQQIRRFIDQAGLEFYRVLTRKPGIVIVKLSNMRDSAGGDGGTIFPEAAYCWKSWRKLFRLEAWLIQLITRASASDWCMKWEHVYKCHNDWLIFRRAK